MAIVLEDAARDVRREILTMTARARAPHVGSALSCVDILVALYFRVARLYPADAAHPDRDRVILSKGHAAAALYACLALRGFFPAEWLTRFAADHSSMAEHPSRGALPGIECTTGSLGHGLGLGTGIALAAKLRGQAHRVFVVMSDGECNEGSVWEAAMWAPSQGLDNLIAIVDFNKLQATGSSTAISSLNPLPDKWRAFGWQVHEVDGHDLSQLVPALEAPLDGRPRAIVAHTIKGKGVSFMENQLEWHYRVPSDRDLTLAFAELGAR